MLNTNKSVVNGGFLTCPTIGDSTFVGENSFFLSTDGSVVIQADHVDTDTFKVETEKYTIHQTPKYIPIGTYKLNTALVKIPSNTELLHTEVDDDNA
jgi:hypothetical protein